MLPWFHAHAPLLIVFAIALVSIALLPLARTKVVALRAWRARRSAPDAGAAAIAVGASLDALTALAATLVLSTEAEVRDLKNPAKPGSWDPSVDGPRFLRRVVADLWHLGGDSLTQLRALQRLDVPSTTKLLERIAEAQVQKLRAPAPIATTATPAELAGLVAEILRDPTASPVRAPGVAHTAQAFSPQFRDPGDGQRGSVSLRALLVVALLSLLALAASCIPARRFVLDRTDGVPARVACTPRTQACFVTDAGVYLPVVYSDECRPWPTLSLRPDGTQRTCAPGEGCEVGDGGIARCTAAADASGGE